MKSFHKNWTKLVHFTINNGIDSQITLLEQNKYTEQINKIKAMSSVAKHKFHIPLKMIYSIKNTMQEREEVIYMAFGIWFQLLQRYNVSPDIPIVDTFAIVQISINKCLKKINIGHMEGVELSSSDDDDEEEENEEEKTTTKPKQQPNYSSAIQDQVILALITDEWNFYKQLVYKQVQGKISANIIEDYFTTVRWKELCDTNDIKQKRLANFELIKQDINHYPIIYKEPLWPYIDKYLFSKSNICLPFLGITFDRPDYSYIQHLSIKFQLVLTNAYESKTMIIDQWMKQWFDNGIARNISNEIHIQTKTWYFHMILQYSSNLISNICMQFKEFKPTKFTFWKFLYQHNEFHDDLFSNKMVQYEPIINSFLNSITTPSPSTNGEEDHKCLFTKLYQEYNSMSDDAGAGTAVPCNPASNDINNEDQGGRNGPSPSKYFNLEKWFNPIEHKTALTLLTEYNDNIRGLEGAQPLHIDEIFALVQKDERLSNIDIFNYIHMRKNELDNEINKILLDVIKLYSKYYWSGLIMIWTARASEICNLIKYNDNKTQLTSNLCVKAWLHILTEKISELNTLHKHHVPNHLQVVKDLTNTIHLFHEHQFICYHFFLWQSCLSSSNSSWKANFINKWNLWLTGQRIKIAEFFQNSQILEYLDFFKSYTDLHKIYNQLWLNGCKEENICFHNNKHLTDYKTNSLYIKNSFEMDTTATKFNTIKFIFSKEQFLTEQFKNITTQTIMLDNSDQKISFNNLLSTPIDNTQFITLKQMLIDYCDKIEKQYMTVLKQTFVNFKLQFDLPIYSVYFDTTNESETELKQLCNYISLKTYSLELLMYLTDGGGGAQPLPTP